MNKIISAKDLSYLCDMFNWNYILAKKSYSYIFNVTDDELKNSLENTYKLHYMICSSIIEILKGGQNE